MAEVRGQWGNSGSLWPSAPLPHSHFSITMSKRAGEEISSTDPWTGWRLFGPRDKNGKHTCLVPVGVANQPCGEVLAYAGTSSNCKRHLKRKHPVIFDELQKMKASPAPPSLAPTQSTLSQFFDLSKVAQSRKAKNELVAQLELDTVRFIAGDIRPFNAVEGISALFHFLAFPSCSSLVF